MYKFALIGVAGYIAPRHLKAIKDTGNELVAALDPHDAVGILDSYFPKADFFTEPERFDRHLEKLRRAKTDQKVDYVSICSPNYLHDAHIRMALRVDAHAICEKPLVLNPWNLDLLEEIEKESGKNVYNVLQLRLHPSIIALKNAYIQPSATKKTVKLTYITSRGNWYKYSWKGDEARAGGLAANIGIHFFDMLIWIFGQVERVEIIQNTYHTISGNLYLANAHVEWKLSINEVELPPHIQQTGQKTYRSITINGQEVEFSDGFSDLHTQVYRQILAGQGYGIKDARPAIELLHAIKHS